jgi:hypothetical protein
MQRNPSLKKRRNKNKRSPSMVVHTCNLSTDRLRQKEFEVSLPYLVRSCLKKEKKESGRSF